MTLVRIRARLGALCLALGLTAGCATYSDRTLAARESAQRGDLVGAEKQLNRLLGTRDSEDLPTKWKKDTALALLERAMILHARGAWKLSARDMSTAEKQLELLDIARDGAGQLGKYVFSDSATKYRAPPSEKLVLNAYNMINYLLLGDLSGARVEAKRFTVMREYIASFDQTPDHGAFGSYLAGFVFERLGEADRALRYYDEALQARPFASLQEPVRRLAAQSGYRTPRIRALLGEVEPAPVASAPAALLAQAPEAAPEPAPGPDPEVMSQAPAPAPGELLVVMSVGRVPYKLPERMPIGAAIGLAGAYITGNAAILQYTAFKVVVYPELVRSGALFEAGELRVDGHAVPLEVASDLHAEIVREYEQIKPKIIGAAISRMIVRAAVAEGARAAGRQAKEGGALIGFLAAAVAEGAMVAADRPDTRSWTLLPAVVYVARVPVAPGEHKVTLAAMGPGGKETRDYSVDIPSGGFSVIDVTTLR